MLPKPVVPAPERAEEAAPVSAVPKPILIESRGVSTHFGFASGVATGLPLIVGYFPVAFALGILAAQMKFSFLAIAFMSFIVFAGASQFAAVNLLAVGAPGWTVILTVFIINFRHFLMSLALAPYLKNWTRPRRLLAGLVLTDETFALHLNQFQSRDPGPAHVYTISFMAHFTWFLGTVAGYWVSWLLPDTRAFGFDIAMPCMFIAMIVLQARDRLLVVSGASAALFALILKAAGASHVAVLIAAIIGATIGAGMERRQEAANGRQ